MTRKAPGGAATAASQEVEHSLPPGASLVVREEDGMKKKARRAATRTRARSRSRRRLAGWEVMTLDQVAALRDQVAALRAVHELASSLAAPRVREESFEGVYIPAFDGEQGQ